MKTTEATNEYANHNRSYSCQALLFACMLVELVKCNAISFLDNNFTWFTCPDFDVVTKKLHVSISM